MGQQQRLLSLDVLRGISVIGMILVNAVAVYHYGTGRPVHDVLMHAPWAGLTVADLVFPFFIFMVGVSMPFALGGIKAREGLTGAITLKLSKRAALLFLIGLGLTLSFADSSEPVRVLGVLQRIGLTFFFGALLFLISGWRTQALIAGLILIGYHGALMLPVPDGAMDLLAPGQNFSSWTDRALLGPYIFQPSAPVPFEPEGLFATLPSIAQALMGALTGAVLKAKGGTGRTVLQLAAVGTGLLILGYGLAGWHPIIKAVWSSTFVLATTGYALLTFAFLIWALDMKGWRGWPVTFARAFGINAITAYVVHTYLLSPVSTSNLGLQLVDLVAPIVGAKAASLVPATAVILFSWLPVEVMRRKGWILKV